MTAARRRDEILQALAGASGPVSAAALAARLGVSRQVVVGDVALLRAAGSPIVATPRGYVLGGGQEGGGVRCTVACRHGLDGLLDELYTVADCGVRRAGCDRGAPGVRPAFGPAAGIQPL